MYIYTIYVYIYNIYIYTHIYIYIYKVLHIRNIYKYNAPFIELGSTVSRLHNH